MSDDRLRTLERRWRQTGAVDDEVEYLRARARAGRLDPARLDLAAWCGHPAARAVLGARAPAPAEDLAAWPEGWAAWAAGLLDPAPEAGQEGRIWFPGNPWPRGHRIKRFEWTGRLVPDAGAWFDLHLKSADYDAEDRHQEEEDEGEDQGDWQSTVVWGNYHAVTLSSTYWGPGGGVQVGGREARLDLDALGARELRADPTPADDPDDAAFDVYLLGHDAVADHRLRFQPAGDGWRLTWEGRVALTYGGDEEYRHRFWAQVPVAAFRGFAVPRGLREGPARELLARFVERPEAYTLVRRRGGRWFVPPAAQDRRPVARRRKPGARSGAPSGKRPLARKTPLNRKTPLARKKTVRQRRKA